ncbi:hypothetical protein [Photobacterium leiognathi]|uniref:hypothetical protein n=1 Tax=Photobacterium leiognathi TaxID=553611 RepID=UPI002739ECA4|nr:hypothetical protein [Photobacterium leiognathi]
MLIHPKLGEIKTSRQAFNLANTIFDLIENHEPDEDEPDSSDEADNSDKLTVQTTQAAMTVIRIVPLKPMMMALVQIKHPHQMIVMLPRTANRILTHNQVVTQPKVLIHQSIKLQSSN